jgi:anti-sigma factor RsiW
MSCDRIESRILGYVDGRLKASEQREVEAHLEKCAACRLRVNEFRAVAGLLDELPQIEPSGAFDARVRARVAAEPARKGWWAWLAPSPRVAFAASMLFVATVWIGSQRVPLVEGPTSGADSGGVAGNIDPNDLPVLENFDVLANFEPLTELPPPVQADDSDQQDTNQQM